MCSVLSVFATSDHITTIYNSQPNPCTPNVRVKFSFLHCIRDALGPYFGADVGYNVCASSRFSHSPSFKTQGTWYLKSGPTASFHIFNPLNAKLNPICHLLALLGAHHILHISRIRVKGHYNHFNAELNPICHLLALLGAHHILHVSRLRVKRHHSQTNAPPVAIHSLNRQELQLF